MEKETDAIWGIIHGNLTSKICHHSMPILIEKNIVTVKKKKVDIEYTLLFPNLNGLSMKRTIIIICLPQRLNNSKKANRHLRLVTLIFLVLLI